LHVSGVAGARRYIYIYTYIETDIF